MNKIAIIPARGGSKGIPKKNIINFCDRPLISWSIENALNTPEIDSVWVSSDCEKILNVSENYGARPILRPPEISGDTATSEAAWIHAIEHAQEKTGKVDVVIALQATSPLRKPDDLSLSIKTFEKENLDSLFSATPIEDFFIWTQANNKKLTSFNYDFKKRKRRQDIAKQFVENGSFYLFKPELLLKQNNRLGGKIGMHLMDFWQMFEIDTFEDLRFCQTLMREYVVNAIIKEQ